MKNNSYLFVFLISLIVAGIAFSQVAQTHPNSNTQVLYPVVKSKSIFAYFLNQNPKPKKIIYGYLPYWSLDKLKYMQLDKLTDVAYFGLNINADGTFVAKSDDGTLEPGYNHWQNDKDLLDFINFAQKSGVRVSLTIISHRDEISDKFLSCRECWDAFLTNLKTQMNLHSIKDVNLNFEYVDFQKDEMANHYTDFVNFINRELDKTYGNSFVTVATFADSFIKPRVTKIEPLSKVADGLFIMAYDFQQPTSDNAGPVAPISGSGVQTEYDLTTMLKDYLKVCPPSKLIFGIPYYGYNWVVEDTTKLSKRIPGNDFIGHSGSQAYSDVMDLVLEKKPEIKWDDIGKVPYFTYISSETGSTREVYFENPKSLQFKYDLINQNNLAGVGIWALGYDGGYQELWNLLGKNFVE